MQILYIHGLDSSPNPGRMQYLEARGHQVHALHLDYRQQPDAYQILHDFACETGTQFIVGSSLGGFLGFWLAEALALPCLLFNPAMHVSLVEARIPAIERRCPQRWVVLGEIDTVVDPQAGWVFFAAPAQQGPEQYVMLRQGLGHEIDPPTYAASVRWAGL
ncbi:MAG: hypothetical protein OHK0039_22940 [Bacteroidia bacterium]